MLGKPTPTERLEKIQELNRNRQAKFYENNKDAVNAKRRAKYALKKNPSQPIQEPVIPEPEPEPVQEPLVIVPKTNKKKITKVTKSVLTYDDAVKKLSEMNLPLATFNKYKDDLKRLVTITECDNILECLKKHAYIIKEVNNSKKSNGEPYANNTIKGIYQSILFIIDNLNLNISKIKYLDQFELSKIKSVDDNQKKIEEEVVLPFKDYLNKVREKFGDNSKMFLISSLYDELTVRDDFALKIINNHKDAIDDKINYILVPKKMACKIIINTYKTDKKYGVISHLCSNPLSNKIKKYITENGLKDGDYLFGNKSLTQFVSSNNPKIAVNGGINVFRHMKITDELTSVKSPEERKALADKMRHSPNVQLKYVRKHGLI